MSVEVGAIPRLGKVVLPRTLGFLFPVLIDGPVTKTNSKGRVTRSLLLSNVRTPVFLQMETLTIVA